MKQHKKILCKTNRPYVARLQKSRSVCTAFCYHTFREQHWYEIVLPYCGNAQGLQITYTAPDVNGWKTDIAHMCWKKRKQSLRIILHHYLPRNLFLEKEYQLPFSQMFCMVFTIQKLAKHFMLDFGGKLSQSN